MRVALACLGCYMLASSLVVGIDVGAVQRKPFNWEGACRWRGLGEMIERKFAAVNSRRACEGVQKECI